MIEITTETVDMPELDKRKYQKLKNRNGKDIWYVFDMETEEERYVGSFENASLACHNLNKKYYKELSVTSDNKDCAVPQSEIASPKPDKSGFAQS